ncbi:MAG: muconolactone Delta-isomerase family protein [Bacteroidia bacterium]|jgi:muconolactone delta-isomerase
MNQYIIDFELPDQISSDFVRLIPAQRRQINELMAEGVILAYALASDRTKVWAAIVAASEDELNEILQSMPLYSYMEPTVYPLAFYNVAGSGLPLISLN